MDHLELGYPVKPYSLNQGFGSNPDYYARFKDVFGNPEKGHNGLDLKASHGKPVYAPCDGTAIFERDAHGGEGIYLKTDRFYPYKDGVARFNLIFWHLIGDTDPKFPSPVPTTGYSFTVHRGDLLGYADNTGAPFESSGDHCHFGMQALNQYSTVLDQDNGFNGCIDPTPYLDGTYAQDTPRDISYSQYLLKEAWKLLAAKFPSRVAAPAAS